MGLRDEYQIYLRVEKALLPSTCGNSDDNLRYFEDFLALRGKDLSRALAKDVGDYLVYMRDNGNVDRTASGRLSHIHCFYKWLCQNGRIEFDPTAFFHIPKTWTNSPRSLSESAVEEMMSAVSKNVKTPLDLAIMLRDHAILEVLYGSGTRSSEVVSLTIQCIDFDNGYVTVQGKGGTVRTIPLTALAVKAVAIYLDQARQCLVQFRSNNEPPLRKDGCTRRNASPKKDTLFLSIDGMPLAASSLGDIVKKANKDASPHRLRHSCATHMVDHGADLRNVQKLLGHADLGPTGIYVGKVAPAQMKADHRQFHPWEKHRVTRKGLPKTAVPLKGEQ
jgi:integrase/recombinase XerD